MFQTDVREVVFPLSTAEVTLTRRYAVSSLSHFQPFKVTPILPRP